MRSRLFRIAHSIKANFVTFGEALAFAWKVIKLQFELCIGVVKFKYKKIDGNLRETTGTRDVPYSKMGNPRPVNYGVLTYFDIESDGWRSCRISNLIF